MYKPAFNDGSEIARTSEASEFGLQGVQPACASAPDTAEMSNLPFLLGSIFFFIAYSTVQVPLGCLSLTFLNLSQSIFFWSSSQLQEHPLFFLSFSICLYKASLFSFSLHGDGQYIVLTLINIISSFPFHCLGAKCSVLKAFHLCILAKKIALEAWWCSDYAQGCLVNYWGLHICCIYCIYIFCYNENNQT